MKTTKFLKASLAVSLSLAVVISLASCNLSTGGSNTPGGDDPEHIHEITFVEGLDATCNKEGVKEHYECTGCGKLFADENGATEIASPETIEKLEHTETIIAAKPDSCTQDGATEGKKCISCGKVLVEPQTIPHTGVIIDGQHYCHATLDSYQAADLTLAYDSESGEYTLVGNGGILSSIVVNNAVLKLKGALTITAEEGNAVYSSAEGKVVFSGCTATVNGDITSDFGYVVVDDGATLNLNGKLRVNGDAVENAEAEFGYDFRLNIANGTVNANCDLDNDAVIIADSMVIGSVKNDTDGNFNIVNTLYKGNGFDNDGAFRWVFAKGVINCIGCDDKSGTAICMGKKGTGNVELMKGITINVENYDYGFGEWYKGYNRYIGIEDGVSLSGENVNHLFHVQGNDVLYARTYTMMEYTLGETNGMALVRITSIDDLIIANKADFESLDFISFPTTEEYDEIQFISWAE